MGVQRFSRELSGLRLNAIFLIESFDLYFRVHIPSADLFIAIFKSSLALAEKQMLEIRIQIIIFFIIIFAFKSI